MPPIRRAVGFPTAEAGLGAIMSYLESYPVWLAALSLLFILLERTQPRQRRPLMRRGFWWDFAYLLFNAFYLGTLVGFLGLPIVRALDRGLESAGLRGAFYAGVAGPLPPAAQIILMLGVLDFAQWCIHNLLHRVRWLWELHKVHHSIENLDWIGNWRYHALEVVVYRSLLFPLSALMGFGAAPAFWYTVLSTVVGHFAHANLRWRVGPLIYLVNSPQMHVWHHTHPDSGPVNRNFGVVLSLWDWLFGTAYAPRGRDPERLGFAGIEEYPRNPVGHLLAPFLK